MFAYWGLTLSLGYSPVFDLGLPFEDLADEALEADLLCLSSIFWIRSLMSRRASSISGSTVWAEIWDMREPGLECTIMSMSESSIDVVPSPLSIPCSLMFKEAEYLPLVSSTRAWPTSSCKLHAWDWSPWVLWLTTRLLSTWLLVTAETFGPPSSPHSHRDLCYVLELVPQLKWSHPTSLADVESPKECLGRLHLHVLVRVVGQTAERDIPLRTASASSEGVYPSLVSLPS